jgi:flavin-dependent dehydrogenase
MGERRVKVIVAGGGPAGLTTAAALVAADRNLAEQVVVLEKATYPREKYCAGAVGGRGDAILAKLGLRPDVPGVPIDGMSLKGPSGEQTARVGGIGRVVRRIEFDHALAEAARRQGVEIVEGARVDDVRPQKDGARVETSAGTFVGRVVIGADGVGSVVRRAMGLGPGRLRAQVLELDTEPTDGDRDRGIIHFDASDRGLPGYYWDFPTVVGGKELVCRGVYHLKVDAPGADPKLDIQARLGARLEAMGLDIRAYKNKRFAERGIDAADRLALGSMLLVGEAAGIDPITGEGIAQAIEYGALAGPFVAAVLRGERVMEDWTHHVYGSRLGRDLRIRSAFVGLFFGPRRPEVERLLTTTNAPLRAGCRHFGALPPEPLGLASLGVRLGAFWLRGALGLGEELR